MAAARTGFIRSSEPAAEATALQAVEPSLRRKGDLANARERLGKAIDIYKERGADGWVTKAEEELAKLL